jgi:hypothetical protein
MEQRHDPRGSGVKNNKTSLPGCSGESDPVRYDLMKDRPVMAAVCSNRPGGTGGHEWVHNLGKAFCKRAPKTKDARVVASMNKAVNGPATDAPAIVVAEAGTTLARARTVSL